MLNRDVAGALDWYARKEAELPDDGPDPCDHLSWALALHRAGREREAFTKLYQADLSNLYLVPLLVGEPRAPLKIWHGSNLAEPEYAEDAARVLLGLWTPAEKAWARSVYENEEVVRLRRRFIELETALLALPVGAKRNAVVAEAWEIRKRRF
jgi:hypothetical protein